MTQSPVSTRPPRSGRTLSAALAAAFLGAATPPAICQSGAMVPVFADSPTPPYAVVVESDQAASGPVTLRFRGLDPGGTQPRRIAESAHYLVAGAPGRMPTATVTRAVFVRVRDGRILQRVDQTSGPEELVTMNQPLIRLNEAGTFRQYAAYDLAFPVAAVGAGAFSAKPDLWVMETLEIRLDPGPPPVGVDRARAETFRPMPGAPPFGGGLLLNPQIDPAFYRLPALRDDSAADRWPRLLDRGRRAGAALRLRLYEGGAYRIDRAAVDAAMGAGAFAVRAPTQWRLFRLGAEVPTLLAGASPGGEAQALVFVAPPPEGADPGREQVYWLFAGGLAPSSPGAPGDGIGEAPPRVEIVASADIPAPAGEGAITSGTFGRFDLRQRRFEDYNARIPGDTSFHRWYWKSLADRKTEALALDLPGGFDPDGAKSVRMTIPYAFPNAPTRMPALEAIANGVGVRAAPITGAQSDAVFQVESALMRPGGNEVAIRMEYPADHAGERSEAFLREVRTQWAQPLGSVEGLAGVPFALDEAGTGPVTVRFAKGAPGALLFARDAAGVGYAVRPRGTDAVMAPAGGPMRFVDPKGGRGPYFALDPASAPAVAAMEPVSGKTAIENPGPTDYLAICPTALQPALAPLLERRRAAGLKVTVIDPQSAFDAFSYGDRDPRALRTLLGRAWADWPAPKLRYVALVGEASDYRGDPARLPEGAQADMVPVCGGDAGEANHGDNPYANVTGTDMLGDLAVGRLPVSTPAELAGLVVKIAAYEDQTTAGQADDSAWQRRAMFVMDDNEEFPKAVDEAERRGLGSPAETATLRQEDYPYTPNAKVAGRKRSRPATEELVRQFDTGSAMMTFFGHGGPNLWSHERLLHLTDMPRLRNSPRLPFVTCASCDNAWLDFPTRPVNASMGEIMVKSPVGGAIGLLGPVAGASPYEHQTLVGRLTEGVVRAGIRAQGEAVLYAKNAYATEIRSNGLPEQYVLLGDPALELQMPPVSDALRFSPAALDGSKPWRATVTGPADAGGGAETPGGVARLRSVRSGDTVATAAAARGSLAAAGGVAFAGDAPLPPGLYIAEIPSRGRVLAGALAVTAGDETTGTAAPAAEARLRGLDDRAAGGPDLRVEGITPFQPGVVPPTSRQPVQFSFRLVNRESTAALNLGARLRRADGGIVAENFNIPDLAPGAERMFNTPSRDPFPEGPTTVTLELLRRGTATTDETTLGRLVFGFPVLAPAKLEFVPGSAKPEIAGPMAVADETVFISAKLHNTGGVPAFQIALSAQVGGTTDSRDAATINESTALTVERIDPGETKDVVFRWEDSRIGIARLTLFANRNRSVAGDEPASIPVPAFEVGPKLNLSLSDLTMEPDPVKSGTTVTLRMSVAADGDTTRGPVEVEFTLRNPLTGVSKTLKRTLPFVGPKATIATRMLVDRHYSFVSATLNGNHEWEEDVYADNTREIPIEVIVPMAADLPPGSPARAPATLDLALEGCAVENMSYVPGQGLRLDGEFSADSASTSVTADTVTTGTYVVEWQTTAGATDNLWSMGYGRVRAFPAEDAGDLRFELPVPGPARPGQIYELVASVAATADPKVAAKGSFDCDTTGTFRRVDFVSPPNKPIQDIVIDTGEFGGTTRTVVIRHGHGCELILYGLKARPLSGAATSALFVLEPRLTNRPATLRLDTRGLDDPGRLRIEIRTGVPSADGRRAEWQPWTAAPAGPTAEIDRTRILFQWRVTVLKGTTANPMAMSARLDIR